MTTKKQMPDFYSEVGAGWHRILSRLHLQLLKLDENYSVKSVKVRFGKLAVYIHNETPEMWQIIAEAEDHSGKMCDICGSYGSVFKSGGILMARCTRHSSLETGRGV